jgi:hypothetical protein
MNVVSKWKEIAATLGLTAGLVAVGHETYEHFYTREEAESEHQEIIEVIKAEQQADRMRVRNDRIDRKAILLEKSAAWKTLKNA